MDEKCFLSQEGDLTQCLVCALPLSTSGFGSCKSNPQ